MITLNIDQMDKKIDLEINCDVYFFIVWLGCIDQEKDQHGNN
jgi:hypothetical protein